MVLFLIVSRWSIARHARTHAYVSRARSGGLHTGFSLDRNRRQLKCSLVQNVCKQKAKPKKRFALHSKPGVSLVSPLCFQDASPSSASFFFFPTASARSVMWCSAPVSPCLFSSLMMAYLLRCFGVPNTHTSLSKDSWMSVLASFGIRAHLVFYSFYFSSLQNAKPKSVCWTTAKWCA